MPESLSAILDRHRERYPLLEAADVYKLVHQGVFGPGHIVSSFEQALGRLRDEFRGQIADCRMRIDGREEPVEEIDPEGRFVRVNLRSLLGRPDLDQGLTAVLVESSNTFGGGVTVMGQRVHEALQWSLAALPVQAVELETLVRGAEPKGWPPVHHSDAYRQTYRPAYRVVSTNLLEASGLL